MPGVLKLDFAPFSTPAKGVLVLFCEEGLKFGSAARKALDPTGDLITRAAAADRFKGKNGSALDLVAPAGLDVSRLVIVGVGKPRDLKPQDFVKLGGIAMGKIPSSAREATIIADLPGGGIKPDRVADIALGVRLRAYAFERYKTKRKEDEERADEVKVTIAVASVAPVEKAFAAREAVASGVMHRARSRQRAGQRALSGGVRPPRRRPEEARRRRRGARRQGDEEARHERAARRRPGLGAREPHRDHALERRQARSGSRSPSSARACASTPAAFRSSRPPAWRT